MPYVSKYDVETGELREFFEKNTQTIDALANCFSEGYYGAIDCDTREFISLLIKLVKENNNG